MRMRIRTMYWAGLLGLFLAACSQPQGQVSPQVAVGPAVTVTKTAVPSFKRTYRWTVEKTVSLQDQELNYQVKLTAKAEDSDWQVSGTVTIKNTGTGAVFIQKPTDVLSTGESVALDCPDPESPSQQAKFPYRLEKNGDSLTCTYQQPLSSGDTRTNTAQVAWGTNMVNFPNTASGQAAFSFTTPTEVVDDQVEVRDIYVDPLGNVTNEKLETVQADRSLKVFSYTISYKRTISACGEYKNTATFTTNTNKSTGSASATVTVPCAGGCTLTQGYWKTHSKYGPAPRDDGWDKIPPSGENQPGGEDALFYNSGQTYIQVLNTPPKGNAYYILAHQFIAAQLNILNGADGSAVSEAMAWAEAFFTKYGPGNVPKDQAALAKSYADLLDQYNNGYIGPGHCSE